LNEQYDVILAQHYLQEIHRYDVLDVLKHWREHLEDEGQLYLTVTDLMWVAETVKHEWNASPNVMAALFGDKDAPHHSAYTMDMVRDVVDRAGFVTKEARTGPYTLGTGENEIIARQLLVVAEKRDD